MAGDTETEAVQVEVRLEPRDYVRFNYWHVLHSTRNRVRLARAVLLAVALGFASYMLKGDARLMAEFVLFIFVPIVILAWVGLLLLLPYRARRSYATNKLLGEPQRYTFSREGVILESASGSSRHNWNVYWKACETRNAFYLYLADNLAHLIPKRSFGSDAELQRFREIARASLDPKACRI